MNIENVFSFRKIVFPLITTIIVTYFTYHVFQGERGVIAFMRMQKKVKGLEAERNTLQIQKEQLEKSVYLLHKDSLDTDLLEERARSVLNFAYPSEIIINGDDVGRRNSF